MDVNAAADPSRKHTIRTWVQPSFSSAVQLRADQSEAKIQRRQRPIIVEQKKTCKSPRDPLQNVRRKT